jgi:transposase
MSRGRVPYPPEFRRQMIELVQAGKTPTQLAREFHCSAQTIANWVAQAARDAGKPLPGKEGLTSAEREELVRLQTERDILAKATAWFAARNDKMPNSSSNS